MAASLAPSYLYNLSSDWTCSLYLITSTGSQNRHETIYAIKPAVRWAVVGWRLKNCHMKLKYVVIFEILFRIFICAHIAGKGNGRTEHWNDYTSIETSQTLSPVYSLRCIVYVVTYLRSSSKLDIRDWLHRHSVDLQLGFDRIDRMRYKFGDHASQGRTDGHCQSLFFIFFRLHIYL